MGVCGIGDGEVDEGGVFVVLGPADITGSRHCGVSLLGVVDGGVVKCWVSLGPEVAASIGWRDGRVDGGCTCGHVIVGEIIVGDGRQGRCCAGDV